MNSDADRNRKEAFQGAPRIGGLLVRVSERVDRWFHRSDREGSNRELSIRLDERCRERARIARALHDTLLQGFLVACLKLQADVQELPEESPCKPSLSSALSLMQRGIEEGRAALDGLRLAERASLNLERAFAVVREEFAPGECPRFRVFVRGDSGRLKPAIQEQIYLIGREALVNAFRHSQATCVETEVEYLPNRLRVIIRDNGCGIDPDIIQSGTARSCGLVGMRERAENVGAQLRIYSRPGLGTEVEVLLAVK